MAKLFGLFTNGWSKTKYENVRIVAFRKHFIPRILFVCMDNLLLSYIFNINGVWDFDFIAEKRRNEPYDYTLLIFSSFGTRFGFFLFGFTFGFLWFFGWFAFSSFGVVMWLVTYKTKIIGGLAASKKTNCFWFA